MKFVSSIIAIGSRGSGDIGTIGNTYILKATGKTQVSGLLANAPVQSPNLAVMIPSW
ncbi:MAG: hypothetical protein ACLSE8_09325 [Parasutterella sp.]